VDERAAGARGGALKIRPGLAALALVWACSGTQAEALRYCDPPTPLTAAQSDQRLRLAALIKGALQASGQRVALIARSGLDLQRFGVRYSHAGVTLLASANAAWSVRQLYYACDERRPKVFDQGLPGFVLGLHDPAVGYVSVVLLPEASAAALEQAALDNATALALLGGQYSANAYPFSTRYQNCNQWVLELLATAWGGLRGDALRERAQAWAQAQGYAPTVFDVGSRVLMWAGALIPWLHRDDHPEPDLDALRYRVSMPASLEAFVQATVPGAQRLEFCQAGTRVVVHRGWEPVAEGCVAQGDDEVVPLD